MKVVWASPSGHTQDGLETCTFFFLLAFCLLIVVSDRAKKKQNTQRESHMKVEQTSAKIPSKIDQNRRKVDEISIFGGFGRSRPLSGSARTHSGRLRDAQKLPKADLGAPRASQERPGVVQKRSQAVSETHPGRIGALPKRVWHTEHGQTRSWSDFATFFRRHAEARSLKFVRPRSVS